MSDSFASSSVVITDVSVPMRGGTSMPARMWKSTGTSQGPCFIHLHGGAASMGQHIYMRPWWVEEVVPYGVTVLEEFIEIAEAVCV